MKTDHRTPLTDTQYKFVGEIDWQPRRPKFWWVGMLLACGLPWGIVIGVIFAAMCIVASGGMGTP